jgi:hypothetical protein
MNDEGFLEHQEIVQYHLKVRKAFGLSSWYSSSPLRDQWWQAPGLAPLKEELKQLITAKFAGRPIWGWKDPRASILLPLWSEVLGELGIEMRVIIPFRNPLDVAASVGRVFNLPMEQSWRLWLYYMLAIRAAVKGIPHLYVDYNTLMRDPRAEGARLQAFIGPGAPADLPEQVAGIIRPSLRHSEHDLAAIEAAAGADVAGLYLECLGCPANTLEPRLICTLDDYLDAANLFNLSRADMSPVFQLSTLYGDYGSPEASQRLAVHRLIPYVRNYRFDETYELLAPGARRLFFQPCVKTLARCRIERVEIDGIPVPQPVRSTPAAMSLDGWDIFPPTMDAVYELNGDASKASKVRICGMLETVVAGTPAVEQEWVRQTLATMITETMAPKPKQKR